MTWQFWFQTDLGFEPTITQLKESNKFTGYSSEKTHWLYNFSFKESKDVKYQISTHGKLSISFPSELDSRKRTDFINQLKPFIKKADGTPAQKFELYTSIRSGKKVDITIYEDLGKSMKIEEANHEDVDECIEAISRELNGGNKDVLSSRVDQLRQLSERKRVAHFPCILKQINEWLESPMFVHDFEAFKNLVETLSNFLFFEQNHKLEDGGIIVGEIQNEISPKIISIIMENPEFPDFFAVTFLGLCRRKEAAEAIFEKSKSNPSEALPRSDTSHALARLYPEHKRFINQQIDDLLKSKDKTLVELAKKRRHEIMHELPNLYG